MKYPNPAFTGMSQVTTQAINKGIEDYCPQAGTPKAVLFDKVTTLPELVDFCIEGYRAWADAVLQGAGAFLKIGEYPGEIAAANEYVKQEVLAYLTGTPFSCPADYDRWHGNICQTLSDPGKFFAGYSAYRKDSKDKFTNKSGFTVGNAQKFLNMLMKDLYACFHKRADLLPGYEDHFRYCHMPLDSYILRFVDDIRCREAIKKPGRTYTWSNLQDYAAYMDEQNDIRSYVAKSQSKATVLQTEFVVWPLYK